MCLYYGQVILEQSTSMDKTQQAWKRGKSPCSSENRLYKQVFGR